MATVTNPEPGPAAHPEVGSVEPFEQIRAPGSYVLKRSGELLRVPEDALQPGRSPAIDIVSKDPWLCTKISNDPYLSVSKARAIAADMDLSVNF